MPASTRLILCEGYEDVQFIKRLIAARGLPDFHVSDTSRPSDRRGGISKFRSKLGALRISETSWFRSLTSVVFIADNDLTPAANFAQVATQVDAVFPGHAPAQPGIPFAGSPKTLIYMMPNANTDGNLEVFLQPNVRSANAQPAAHTDHFMAISNAMRWGVCRLGKAWMRSNLAIQYADPCAPVGEILRDSQTIFDFNDASLDHLANALSAMR